MKHRATFRGQPLLLLGIVILGWLALRVMLWELPFDQAANGLPHPRLAALATRAADADVSPGGADERKLQTTHDRSHWKSLAHTSSLASRRVEVVPAPLLRPSPRGWEKTPDQVANSLPEYATRSVLEVDPAPIRPFAEGFDAGISRLSMNMAGRRWSFDAWVLLRGEGVENPLGPGLSNRPGYGRSQTGAVVRYSLPPLGDMQPKAQVRMARALDDSGELEIAFGLSVRPLPAIPVTVTAETRVNDSDQGTRLRPAVYAVSGLPPVDLPLGLRGEGYVQAGYVGGEAASAFADGQARVERDLANMGEVALSAGAGVWGGAQKDAARLDIGPSAAATFPLGELRVRIAADYRFRIAGRAEPASGPALTVSAGF
ncbi:MAG TPA: hypothetical protein VNR60_08800 [Croceibacterium sp.]|nr:hypothetical protein [Croceibacterium sp.]